MRNLILQFALVFINLGLTITLTFGVFILLRPVTNRLLRPKYRVILWTVGWLMGYSYGFYAFAGLLEILPVTFRGWITPRIGNLNIPSFMPDQMDEAGTYSLVLPGGVGVPFTVTDGMLTALAIIWVVGMVLAFWYSFRAEGKLKRLSQQGVEKDRAWLLEHGATEDDIGIVVRIAENLPTSFVRRGNDNGRFLQHIISLQAELPEERMRLVLLHELEHIRQHHPWAKGLASVLLLCVYWWNPILWMAFRLTCRDMELACDEAVLASLEEKDRREYARTLVDLGSGKYLWGTMTSFGECDAQLRVRRTVNWKKERKWAAVLIWPALILIFMFLFTTPSGQLLGTYRDWDDYLEGPGVVEDIRRELNRPDLAIQGLWGTDDWELYILDSGENWYHANFIWTGNTFAPVFVQPDAQPDDLHPARYRHYER